MFPRSVRLSQRRLGSRCMCEIRFRRAVGVLHRCVGTDVVVLLPNDEVAVLTGGAAAIWTALGTESRPASEIYVQALGAQANVDDHARAEEMLDQLVALGAVERP